MRSDIRFGLHFPTATEFAHAVVLSALANDELSALLKNPDAALRGEVVLVSRWYAARALAITHPMASADIIGALIGCGAYTTREFRGLHEREWWSVPRLYRIVDALTVGEFFPNAPVSQLAVNVRDVLEQRFEDRLSIPKIREKHFGARA